MPAVEPVPDEAVEAVRRTHPHQTNWMSDDEVRGLLTAAAPFIRAAFAEELCKQDSWVASEEAMLVVAVDDIRDAAKREGGAS